MGTKGCLFESSQIEMGFRVGGSLQFPKKVKESVLLDTLRSISAEALPPVCISVLNFDALNGTFEKIHKDFSQEWGNVLCSICGENSFKVDLSNLDARSMRQLQLFQKLKVEKGSRQFNPLAAMATSISLSGLGASFGFNAPIFSKKPQQSSKKVYSQAWETEHFYYPLAAKAATISLLNFRASNFGFDAFCGTSKKLHKQDSSQRHGNCRMTRSYRNVQTIVAKASNTEFNFVPAIMTTIATTVIATSLPNQPMLREILMRVAMSKASNIEYECMSTIMTVVLQNLMSQPKLQEILLMGAIAVAVNFPLGVCREHSKFSPPWLTCVLASIPYIGIISNIVLMPKITVAYTLGATILGQVLGSMAEQHRLKVVAAMYPPTQQYTVYYSY